MTWKRIAAVAAIVLAAAAFMAGYIPEHQLRMTAEQETVTLRERLRDTEARVRMGQLLGQVLSLREVVIRQNYGQAQDLSSTFFNSVRTEATATPLSEFRDVLNEVLSRRDAITASLTKADPAVGEMLHVIEVRMRGALGYSLPPEGLK